MSCYVMLSMLYYIMYCITGCLPPEARQRAAGLPRVPGPPEFSV